MTDVNDPTKYKLVAAALRAQIEDGTISFGQAVPLTELATQTQWSRQRRRAIPRRPDHRACPARPAVWT